MTPASTIAASLSDAQKRAIMEALGEEPILITRFEHFRSTNALYAKGLIYRPMTPAALSPLGQEVRRHLLKEGESSDG